MSKKIEVGKILIAQPFMDDPNFKRSVIGLTEHTNEGTVGFILNKPMNTKLTDLMTALNTDEDYDVYFGGPVSMDTVHYVHNVGDLLEESIQVSKGIYWGGNFKKLIFLMESGLINKKNIRFFVGYSGWTDGQLAGELASGSWIMSDWHANYSFQSNSDKLWPETLAHKGSVYSVIAQIPTDSSNN